MEIYTNRSMEQNIDIHPEINPHMINWFFQQSFQVNSMGERIIISINGLEQLDIHIKTEQKEKRTGERKEPWV